MKTNYFKIGEIADIYGISVQTLRHYEKIGLLHPAYIDPITHYRYYGYEQTEVLNTIRYLRALDTPLEDIHAFINNRNVDLMENMLISQQQKVSKKIEDLHKMQQRITNRLSILQKAKNTEIGVIQQKEYEALPYICIKQSVQPTSYLDLENFIVQMEKQQKEIVVFLGNVGLGISNTHLQQKEYLYDSVFILLDENDVSMKEIQIIPSCLTLTLQFHGTHQQAKPYYKQLDTYMQAHNLAPIYFSREITIIDEGITNDTSQYMTEISIPVRYL